MLRVSRRKLPLLAAAIGATLPTLGFSQTWNFNNGNALSPWTGTWSTAANWNPNSAFPNGITAAVVFPTAMVNSASGTVTLNGAAITVGRVDINPVGTVLNGNSYTIAGAGTLNLIGGGTIQVQSSGTVSAGVATFNNTLATPVNSSITKTGLGALFLNGANQFGGGSSTEFSGLTVASGAVIANSAGALTGLKAISTGGDGQLELRNQTVGTIPNPVIGAVGATVAPVNGSIYASTGTNVWNGNFFLLQNASMGVGAGATLTVNGNVFTDGAGTVGNGLTKVGAGTLEVRAFNLNGPIVVQEGRAKVAVNGTVTGTSSTSSLSIAGGAVPTAALDLADNDLVIDYDSLAGSPLATIKAQIKAAYNGGAWTGQGLTTSKGGAIVGGPFNGKSAALGYAERTEIGNPATFSGVTLLDSSVLLVKYTLAGDADLDGDVDGNDVAKWAVNFTGELGGGPTALKNWVQGDWDYDGDVDGNDVAKWAVDFTGELGGAGLGPVVLPASVNLQAVSLLEGLGVAVSVVPEPASVGLLGLGVLGMVSRRRRR